MVIFIFVKLGMVKLFETLHTLKCENKYFSDQNI